MVTSLSGHVGLLGADGEGEELCQASSRDSRSAGARAVDICLPPPSLTLPHPPHTPPPPSVVLRGPVQGPVGPSVEAGPEELV
ncbi:hypothetical protein NQZ68_003149 [Dissostichus eleginoides]|nr:hypothetical protein NQZ68_003149 [Dissostichus eleginoides]